MKNHGAFSQKVPNISSSWLKPLNNLVRKQPQVAHAIIRQLLGCGEEFADNNAFFQSLYLDLIREHLTRSAELDTSVRRISEHNDPGEHEQSMLEAHKLCCDTIHQLLVAMDPRSDIIEPEVDELLMNLLHRVQSSTLQRLSKGTIYSALLAHSSDYLFQKFCDIENDWQLGVCCSSSVELTPFSRMFLPSETLLIRSCGKPRPDAWKLFYFYARRNNHILEDVVVSCSVFFLFPFPPDTYKCFHHVFEDCSNSPHFLFFSLALIPSCVFIVF